MTGPAATPASYVYGIVPAATRTGAVQAQVALVRHRGIAALVRALPARPGRPTRRDLMGHAELLDRLAETTPVLPMRFGTLVASPEVVERDLLRPHHDTFAAALTRLTGRAQFTVRATYRPDAALREVLAEQPQALRLHRRGRPAAPGQRVRLGEFVARAVAAKREADAAALDRALGAHAVASRVRVWQSAAPDPIAEAAFLVELRHRDRFEAAAERLAQQWHGRVRLRLLGPMAPYHFVADLPAARR